MLDRLVALLVPRSPIQWVYKFLMFELVIACGVLGVVDLLELPPPTLRYLAAGAIVSSPVGVLLLGVMRHQAELQRRLKRLAYVDFLTGLPNRLGFFQATMPDGKVSRAGVLILLDVDHFKAVNDTYGHDVGDLALKSVAVHLADVLGEGAMLGRHGGEEFAVFLSDHGPADVAGKEAALVGPIVVRDEESLRGFTLTLSGGAVAVRRGTDRNQALRAADVALYKSKSAGRARLTLGDIASGDDDIGTLERYAG